MFKHKTGCETPKLRKYTTPPMSPIKPAKEKDNKTMYGVKLYIPFEDLNAYIHSHTSDRYKNHTFIPVKAEINEFSCDIEISLVSANPIEFDNVRYKLDLNELIGRGDEKPQRGLRAKTSILDDYGGSELDYIRSDKTPTSNK